MHLYLLHSRKLRSAFGILFLLSIASKAFAQISPADIPSNVKATPGLIQQYDQRPEAKRPVAPEPSLTAPPEPTIEQPKPATPSVDGSLSQKFMVKTIDVEGDKHLPEGQVRALLSQYENREINFTDLKELADKLTEMYRQAGYVTSIVYIGPQKIENGHVVLKASEGIVGRAVFEKGKYFKSLAVMPRIDATDGKTFQLNDLKRSIRRINDNPDMKVHATLTPGELPEQTNVELELTEEHFPLHITPFWDNLGRSSVGNQRFGITTQHNNMLGLGDRAFNSVNWTRYSFGTTTHYGIPVGKHGTWVNFDHAFSTLRIGTPQFRSADIRGKAVIFSPSISQELLNTDHLKLSADLAFDFMDVDTFWHKTQPLSEDRLRVLRPGLNFDAFDRYGRTIMRHEFGIGLNAFDGTPNKPNNSNHTPSSRQGAGTQFFRYTGNITRLQKMPFGTYAIFRSAAQLTPQMLLPAQQYQLGGTYTVRGYKEGRFVGDAGYLFSAEWRAPFVLFPKTWTIPRTNYKLRENVQFVSFADFGGSFTNSPAPGVHSRDYLLGTGAGIRVNLTRHLAGRVDLGVPLKGDTRSPRVHFGLETRLF